MPFDQENIKDHLENEFIDPEATYTQTTNYLAEELNKALQKCNQLSQNYEELQKKYEQIMLKTDKLENENKKIKKLFYNLI